MMGVPASLDKNMMGLDLGVFANQSFCKAVNHPGVVQSFMPLAVHQGSYSMGKLTFIFCP